MAAYPIGRFRSHRLGWTATVRTPRRTGKGHQIVGEVAALDDATARAVALLDLGSGSGGSLTSAQRRFGVEGVGIERDVRWVRKAQEAGQRVFEGDIRDLDPTRFPAVDYVMLDNVLEHMPDLSTVEEVLAQALRVASRLVHVRHPSFEDIDYLAGLGLKQYWTDWNSEGGHTAPVRLHEFVAMANRAGVYRIAIQPVKRELDSNDVDILPLSAPPFQTRTEPTHPSVYDEARHGPKPQVSFDRPVYFAFDLLFCTGPVMPQSAYRADSESDPGRPFFVWEGEPPPPFLTKLRGAAGPPEVDLRTPVSPHLRHRYFTARKQRRMPLS